MTTSHGDDDSDHYIGERYNPCAYLTLTEQKMPTQRAKFSRRQQKNTSVGFYSEKICKLVRKVPSIPSGTPCCASQMCVVVGSPHPPQCCLSQGHLLPQSLEINNSTKTMILLREKKRRNIWNAKQSHHLRNLPKCLNVKIVGETGDNIVKQSKKWIAEKRSFPGTKIVRTWEATQSGRRKGVKRNQNKTGTLGGNFENLKPKRSKEPRRRGMVVSNRFAVNPSSFDSLPPWFSNNSRFFFAFAKISK